MSTPHRILLVEDNDLDAQLLDRELKRTNVAFSMQRVQTKETFLRKLHEYAPTIIISDYHQPTFSALEALRLMKQQSLEIPFIVLTSTGNEEIAVEILKEGADDYLLKKHLRRLPVAIENALSKKKTEKEIKLAEEHLRSNEQLLREITDNIHEVFWMMEPAKNTMLFISPAYEIIWGRTRKSLYESPRDWLDAIHPEDRERVLRSATTNQARGTYNELYRIIQPNGAIRWIHDRAFPVKNDAGNVERIVGIAKDITEQKRIEELQQENTRRISNILERMDEAFVSLDTNWIYTYVNSLAATMFGRKKGELEGKHIWTEFPEGVGQKFYHAYYKAVETQEAIYLEEYYPPYDKWFENRIYPSKEGLAIFFRDVTEKKKHELALRQSEEKYRSLVENSPDIITITDNSGIIQFINFTLPGFSKDKTIGTSIYNYIHQEYHQTVREALQYVFDTKSTHAYEIKGYGEYGKPSYYYTRIGPIFHQGEIIGITHISTDITEHKLIEERLRESELKFRTLTESTNSAIFIYQGKNIKYVNPAAQAMTGYSYEELLQMSFWEIMHPDFQELVRERGLKRLKGESVPNRYELKILTKQNDIRWLDFTSSITEYAGEIAAFGTAFDITERVKAEDNVRSSREQLRHLSQRLQEIREEERTLIAREIHDELGQQLTGLKMDITMVEKKIADAEMKNNAAVQKKLRQMKQLIDETIQTVRKISSELRPGILDDLGLVPAIEWQAKEFFERTGVRCALETSLEHLELQRNSSTTLFRILQESLTNVSRHANATRVKITLATENENVQLTIEDNGKGIPPEKIFESESLGLLGMRERAAALGGRVEIRSEKRKGTCVCVVLPINY
jgi:PAS domain S-box-containing protein